jgi:hypothetical protein
MNEATAWALPALLCNWLVQYARPVLLESAKRAKIALSIVGDAKYVTLLYVRFCRSQWRFTMTFERWLKRRQRIRNKQRGR